MGADIHCQLTYAPSVTFDLLGQTGRAGLRPTAKLVCNDWGDTPHCDGRLGKRHG